MFPQVSDLSMRSDKKYVTSCGEIDPAVERRIVIEP
jgi:hypothetical protein